MQSHGAAGSAQLVVDSRRVLTTLLFVCVSVEVILFLLDLTINHQRGSSSGAIRRLFNTAREDGLASWFAIVQTFAAALTAWGIVILNSTTNAAARIRIGWFVIAVFFTYLCMDDGAKIHERLGTAAETWLEDSAVVAHFPSYTWQIVVGPFFALMGVVILLFLWREFDSDLQRVGLLSALACFAVAVSMDFVEGLDDGYAVLRDAFGAENSTIRHFSKSLEECIEMLGMSLFLTLFLSHLMARFRSVRLQFD